MVVLMTPNHIDEVEDVCSKYEKRTISNEQSLFYMLSPPAPAPLSVPFLLFLLLESLPPGITTCGPSFQDVANPGQLCLKSGALDTLLGQLILPASLRELSWRSWQALDFGSTVGD